MAGFDGTGRHVAGLGAPGGSAGGPRKPGVAKHAINIQDGFLFQSLKVGQSLTIELMTGRTLEGKLKRFDRFALVVEAEGREILVYKHAVAMVSAPAGAVGGSV